MNYAAQSVANGIMFNKFQRVFKDSKHIIIYYRHLLSSGRLWWYAHYGGLVGFKILTGSKRLKGGAATYGSSCLREMFCLSLTRPSDLLMTQQQREIIAWH